MAKCGCDGRSDLRDEHGEERDGVCPVHVPMLARAGESGVARPLRDRADVFEIAGRAPGERSHELALAQPDLT